jgi:hypothetical protein
MRSVRALPLMFLLSTTVIPPGPIARWSMLAVEPGIRRSCKSVTSVPASSLARRLPTRSSPSAPFFQATVLGGSSVIRANATPSTPSFWRARSSRVLRRRSYSRRALAPGLSIPRTPALTEHVKQVTTRRAGCHVALVAAGSLMRQIAQRSGRRSLRSRDSRFSLTTRPSTDHRQSSTLRGDRSATVAAEHQPPRPQKSCPERYPQLGNYDPRQPAPTGINACRYRKNPCKWATRNEGVPGLSPGVGLLLGRRILTAA